LFYTECNTLPLNGSLPILQGNYDQCIGDIRLYCCVHGEALDVNSLLGPKKVIYSTAKAGTHFIRVTYEDEDGSHEFSLVVDGREGWNYDWINKHGVFEYNNSSSNPYVIDGATTHVDFESSYTKEGLCPHGHGLTLLGPPTVRVACKILSDYRGILPAPPQVRFACSIFVTYLLEAMKLHDVHHFTSMSLLSPTMCSLDDLDIRLSMIMKRWSWLSVPQTHFLIRQMYYPSAVKFA